MAEDEIALLKLSLRSSPPSASQEKVASLSEQGHPNIRGGIELELETKERPRALPRSRRFPNFFIWNFHAMKNFRSKIAKTSILISPSYENLPKDTSKANLALIHS